MYWQVVLAPEPRSSDAAQWLPEKWTPAPKTSHATTEANGSDTGSVSDDTETPEAAALTISMIEAMLRLIARYPGLVEKVAHAIPKQPGQSHLDNFNTMMAATSDQARYHSGLGVAISETLKPFRELDR